MGLYLRPTDLDEAVVALAERPMTILAGGTDLYPAHVGRPLGADILDICEIAGLRGITECSDHFRLGATTTWSDLLAERLPPWFGGLKSAAREVGGVQIQNAGTIAGNLCNASPAADGIPALLALDASVELVGRGERRHLTLPEFVLGNRRTARRPHEILTAVLVPKPRHAARAGFAKLGARKYLVISIVMVAAILEVDAGRVAAARVAIGACSPVARRLFALEHRLVGAALARGLAGRVMAEDLDVLSPIDDARGTAAYRRDAARTMIGRVLDDLAAQRPGG
jgi:CO/xanthine dehydrogenase FAD-binding subunit